MIAGAASGSAAEPTAAQLARIGTTVLASDDTDRIVDSNETFTFSVEIQNVGDATATGINATFSGPGLSVSQAASAYPDLPPGAAASNTTAFAARAGLLSCGGRIGGTLAVSTQQGSFSVPVVIPVVGTTSMGSWTSTTPVDIPDLATARSSLQLPPDPSARVIDVNVRIGELRHTWVEDLVIAVDPPGTVPVTLSAHRGTGENFLGTTFDDEAAAAIASGAPPFTGAFRPETTRLLAALDGVTVGGTWTLEVRDSVVDDSGRLHSWGLDIVQHMCNNAPLARIETRTVPTAGRRLTVHSISRDEDGEIVEQAWDLDDDAEFDDGTGTSVTFTPRRAGRHPLRLRVVDDKQNVSINANGLIVHPAPVCRVPRVVGRRLRSARAAITRAGCRVGRVRLARSRRVGRVVSQRPRGGVTRPRGTRVAITVGRR